jgi:hypothetical protein
MGRKKGFFVCSFEDCTNRERSSLVLVHQIILRHSGVDTEIRLREGDALAVYVDKESDVQDVYTAIVCNVLDFWKVIGVEISVRASVHCAP